MGGMPPRQGCWLSSCKGCKVLAVGLRGLLLVLRQEVAA